MVIGAVPGERTDCERRRGTSDSFCTCPAYRVIGRDEGVTRNIATSGQATFADGLAVGFIGAAIDFTAKRRIETAIRISEAQFRSFAAHSSNLI